MSRLRASSAGPRSGRRRRRGSSPSATYDKAPSSASRPRRAKERSASASSTTTSTNSRAAGSISTTRAGSERSSLPAPPTPSSTHLSREIASQRIGHGRGRRRSPPSVLRGLRSGPSVLHPPRRSLPVGGPAFAPICLLVRALEERQIEDALGHRGAFMSSAPRRLNGRGQSGVSAEAWPHRGPVVPRHIRLLDPRGVPLRPDTQQHRLHPRQGT